MWSWLVWWRPPCLLRRVIINLQHDPSEAVEGVLWAYRGGWLTLRDVSGLKAGQDPAPIIGDVIVHRSNVAYTQVLP
jgi:hypothetical protein